MNGAARLERLEAAVLALRQAAAGAAVVVEGLRDVQALEALGIGGRHHMIHNGKALQVRIDEIAEDAARAGHHVILLTDWDRTGGRLADRLAQGLAGRVPLDLECRRRVAVASHARCVQDVPADLASLRRRFGSLDPRGG